MQLKAEFKNRGTKYTYITYQQREREREGERERETPEQAGNERLIYAK